MSQITKASMLQGTAAIQNMTNRFARKLSVSLTYGEIVLITMLASSYLVVAVTDIHLRPHDTREDIVCRLFLEKQKC